MIIRKFYFLVAFEAIIVHLTQAKTMFKSAKCTVLDSASITLNYCYVKPYSRTVSYLNVGIDVKRKLDAPVYVTINLKI